MREPLLRLKSSSLNLNYADVKARISRFIKGYFDESSAKGIVVSLSGGIDSCTVAALSALAIGGNRVVGLMLPEKETYNVDDIEHARLVTGKSGIRSEVVDITSSLEAIYRSIPNFDQKDKLCKGNIKARTRIIYVYYYANKHSMLVCGSSDKSETMMGYFTKWGDVAADISPIMDLYKTQVRKLANHIGIPKKIISKPSTPALWPGQTAETELGIGYEQLDLILYGLEHFMKAEDIAEQVGLKKQVVDRVRNRWLSSEHKRRMLLTTKLEYRTIGKDFRLPRNP